MQTTKPRIKREISSGGIIYKGPLLQPLIALIARNEKSVWCLPKGKVEKGEAAQETAAREVTEETGLRGQIIQKVGDIDYWYYSRRDRARIFKTVHFYLFKYISGTMKDHDYEVDDVKWFPIDQAIKVLTYPSERELMKKAKTILSRGL